MHVYIYIYVRVCVDVGMEIDLCIVLVVCLEIKSQCSRFAHVHSYMHISKNVHYVAFQMSILGTSMCLYFLFKKELDVLKLNK